MDRITGNLRIRVVAEEGGEDNAIEVTYSTRVDDGLDRELTFIITVGEHHRGMGHQRALERYAVIYQKQNDFQVEEFNSTKAREVGQAYLNAAKICDLLEESYPQVNPTVRKWVEGEMEYGYASSDSDGLPF